MIRTTAKPFSFRKIKRQSHRLKTKEHPHGVLNGLRGSSEGIEISHCILTRTTRYGKSPRGSSTPGRAEFQQGQARRHDQTAHQRHQRIGSGGFRQFSAFILGIGLIRLSRLGQLGTPLGRRFRKFGLLHGLLVGIPRLLRIFRSGSRRIAGTVPGIAGAVTGIAGTVTGTAGTVTGTAGTVTGTAGTVTGIAGTVTGIAGTVTGTAGTVTGIAGTVTGIAGAVTGTAGTPF